VGRGFFVLFWLVIGISIAAWHWNERYVHPSEWYFYTQGEGAETDIRSPTERAIIGFESIPKPSYPAYNSMLIDYLDRCGMEQLIARHADPLLSKFRNVQLCNSATMDKEQFGVADKYFRERVDHLYSQMYDEIIEGILAYVGTGILMRCGLLLFWKIVLWISAGKRREA
jgi:hypothetical protein